MATPVVTNKWSGNFDCGTCRRKRLMGEEFSKKALERHRKNGGALKCKQCVAASEREEREEAQARKQQQDVTQRIDEACKEETRKCAGTCGDLLPQAAFNRNQWMKGEGKSRCRDCVEQAVKEESAQQVKSNEERIAAAKTNVEKARAAGDSAKIVAAESVLAALEAEKVTGLKPVKLSAGRGRSSDGRRPGRLSERGQGLL